MNNDRETQVIELLKNNNWHLNVADISNELGITDSTTRRILQRLSVKGIVQHNYGKVDLLVYNSNLTPFKYRIHKDALEKQTIARLAVCLVKENDVVFLDGSSTSYYIAEYLKSFSNIKIITNNIEILYSMIEANLEVYSTGGQVSKENRSVLVGDFAYAFVKDIQVDVAFFSTSSIKSNGDIYDACENENFIKRTMIKNSRKKYLACVSNKINLNSTFKLCNVSEFDAVITENKAKFNFTNGYQRVIDDYNDVVQR